MDGAFAKRETNEELDVQPVREIVESKPAVCIPADKSELYRLNYIQDTLLSSRLWQMTFSESEQGAKAKLLESLKLEKSGRTTDGEVLSKGPILGPATMSALKRFEQQLSLVAVPEAYAVLKQANLPIPPGGPLLCDRRELATDFLSKASSGERKFNFGLPEMQIPGQSSITKINETIQWLDKSFVQIREAALAREIHVTNHMLHRRGFPAQWRIDSKQDVVNGQEIMSRTDRFARLLMALDHMARTAQDPTIIGDFFQGTNREELRARLRDLPKCISFERGLDGDISTVSFDFGGLKDVNINNPEWQRLLKELDDWSEKNEGPVNALKKDWLTRGGRHVPSFQNVSWPHGWVKQEKAVDPKTGELHTVKDQAGAPNTTLMQSERKPQGDGWTHFNRIYRRCGLEEVPASDGSGNKLYKIWTENSFYEIPIFGYMDIGGTQSPGIESLKVVDEKPRKGSDWTFVQNGSGDLVPMRVRDVPDFAFEQELLYRGGQAVQVAMDVSMVLLAVPELIAATRVASAANTARASLALVKETADTANMLAKAAEARSAVSAAMAGQAMEANSLFARLASSDIQVRLFQPLMAEQAFLRQVHAGADLIAGASGICTTSPGAMEFGPTKSLHELRSMYFMTMIAKGTLTGLYDKLAGAPKEFLQLPTFRPSEIESFMRWQHFNQHPLLLGSAALGQRGMSWAQYPMGILIVKHMFHHQDQQAEKTELTDSIEQAPGAQAKESESADRLKRLQSSRDVLADLQKSLSPESKGAQLLKKADTLLTPDWLKENRQPNPAEQQEWQTKVDTFIKDELASEFLLDRATIVQYQQERLKRISSDEANEHPELDAADIHELETSNALGIFDQETQKVAGLMMMLLLRNADGSFRTVGGVTKDSGVLFRTVNGNKNVVQEIRLNDIVKLYEADLLSEQLLKTNPKELMHSGDILFGLGRSAHAYANNLQLIIKDSNQPKEVRMTAIRRLVDVAYALNPQGELSDEAKDSPVAGYYDFLRGLASDSTLPREQQLFSLYAVYLKERRKFDKSDKADTVDILLTQADDLESKLEKLFVKTAFSIDCKSAEDWDRKITACILLDQYMARDGKLKGIGRDTVAGEIARCALKASIGTDNIAVRQGVTTRAIAALTKLHDYEAIVSTPLEHLERSSNELFRKMASAFRSHAVSMATSDATDSRTRIELLKFSHIWLSDRTGSSTELQAQRAQFRAKLVESLHRESGVVSEEIKQRSVFALGLISDSTDRDCERICRRLADPTNEKSSSVRFAALQVLHSRLAPADWQEFGLSILNRPASDSVAERDPALVAFLTKYVPERSALGDQIKVKHNVTRAGLPRAEYQSLMFSQLPLLEPSLRHDEFKRLAKLVVGDNRMFSAWLCGFDPICGKDDEGRDTFYADGMIYTERAKQRHAWHETKARFDDLCVTAIGSKDSTSKDETQQVTAARFALFQLIATPTETMMNQIDRNSNKSQADTSYRILPIEQRQFNDMKLKAAQTLASALAKDFSGDHSASVPDLQKQQIVSLAYALVAIQCSHSSKEERNGFVKAKTMLLAALESFEEANTGASIALNANEIVGGALLDSAGWKLADPSTSQAFQLRAIHFLSKKVDADADKVLRGVAASSEYSSAVRLRAAELVTRQQRSLSTTVRSAGAMSDIGALEDAIQKVESLARLKAAAPADYQQLAKSDTAVQKACEESIVHKIMSRIQGPALDKESDERLKLRQLFDSAPTSRIKLAAASVFLEREPIAQDAQDSLKTIIEIATSDASLRLRQDAVDKLVACGKLKEIERYECASDVVNATRAALEKQICDLAGKIFPASRKFETVAQAVDALAREGANHGEGPTSRKLLLDYCACLRLSALIEMRSGRQSLTVADDLRNCINLLAGRSPKVPLEGGKRFEGWVELRQQLSESYNKFETVEEQMMRYQLGVDSFELLVEHNVHQGSIEYANGLQLVLAEAAELRRAVYDKDHPAMTRHHIWSASICDLHAQYALNQASKLKDAAGSATDIYGRLLIASYDSEARALHLQNALASATAAGIQLKDRTQLKLMLIQANIEAATVMLNHIDFINTLDFALSKYSGYDKHELQQAWGQRAEARLKTAEEVARAFVSDPTLSTQAREFLGLIEQRRTASARVLGSGKAA